MKQGDVLGNTIAGALGGLVFLGFLFGLNLGLLFSLLAAVGAYLGGMLIFVVARRQERSLTMDLGGGVSRELLQQTIQLGESRVAEIQRLAGELQDPDMRAATAAIAGVVRRIFENFKNDPRDIKAARSFLNYQLDACIAIIKKYVDLCSRDVRSPEISNSLARAEDTLRKVHQVFEKLLARLLEDDVLDLDSELAVFEQTLKAEGLSID